jgi:hypothetical protein
MLISLKKRTNSGSFPFRKHTAHASSKFIFKYIFHLLSIHDICLTDGHTFSGAIICMKFNGFQAFLRKRREKVLFMMSFCSQIRNNLQFFLFWYTWHLFYFPITQIKLLSRHILDQEKFWACLCTQLYLVLCT